ncbi:hypothetical protein Bca52824_013716 [Brassica carinata]|uniref:Uncharacterized protein n=1 Tax=Brassica carinata TaxID=52824 RepID=A0A8X7W195_BRACI|nr:hypothetical protein Bca52824_013716 [Brassica carinata]
MKTQPPLSVSPPIIKSGGLYDAFVIGSIIPMVSSSLLEVSNDDQTHPVPFNNYTSLLKSTKEIKELGAPSKHISCVSFVFIPDDNIEAAKEELFHGNVPPMGMIIGVLNAVWAKSGPHKSFMQQEIIK